MSNKILVRGEILEPWAKSKNCEIYFAIKNLWHLTRLHQAWDYVDVVVVRLRFYLKILVFLNFTSVFISRFYVFIIPESHLNLERIWLHRTKTNEIFATYTFCSDYYTQQSTRNQTNRSEVVLIFFKYNIDTQIGGTW